MTHPQRRAAAATALVLALALALAASAAAPAKTAPARFALSIHGTQRFEWAIDGGLEEIAKSPACAFRGKGTQTLEFATPPGLTVVPTDIWGPTGAPGGYEFRALVGGKRQRLIPLRGKETRDYETLVVPQVASCPMFRDLSEHGYGQSCQGTNPFTSRAGVVLVRYHEQLEMHTPVDALLYPRRPATCDLRLFDLRNTVISQLSSWAAYRPVRGGNLARMSGRLLTATGHIELCVRERDSGDYGVSLRDCDKPTAALRGTKVTGRITHDWTISLRRL
jgi:hypothetical protein